DRRPLGRQRDPVGDLWRQLQKAVLRHAEVIWPRDITDDEVALGLRCQEARAVAHRDALAFSDDRMLGVKRVDEVVVAEQRAVIEQPERLSASFFLAGNPQRVAAILARRDLDACKLPVEPILQGLFHRGVVEERAGSYLAASQLNSDWLQIRHNRSRVSGSPRRRTCSSKCPKVRSGASSTVGMRRCTGPVL